MSNRGFGGMPITAVDNADLGREIGRGMAEGMQQSNAASSANIVDRNQQSLLSTVVSKRWNVSDSVDAATENFFDPAEITYAGFYPGSADITAMYNGEYNFQLWADVPRWRDLVGVDIYFTNYGVAVNEQGKPDLSTKQTRNKQFNFVQCRDVQVRSSVRMAQQQMQNMLKAGIRWWNANEKIGSMMVSQEAQAKGKNDAEDNKPIEA